MYGIEPYLIVRATWSAVLRVFQHGGYKSNGDLASLASWNLRLHSRYTSIPVPLNWVAIMARFLGTIAGLSLSSAALAASFSSPLLARQNTASPCAQVAALVAAQPKDGTDPTVPAQLAMECLVSVPFHQGPALKLIESTRIYLQWQSTTAWLKDPPKEYAEKVRGPFDLWGQWENIRNKVRAGSYKNEYEFGLDVYELFHAPHDSHLLYVPDSFGSAFLFGRPMSLVSVSSDGQEMPKPYVQQDIVDESLGDISWTPSPISKINGQDAIAYLEDWAEHGRYHDRDALYNELFYGLPALSLAPGTFPIGNFAGDGRSRWHYPGPTTDFLFENGTTRSYENMATVQLPHFNNVTDGESLYQVWYTGNPPLPQPWPPIPTPTNQSASAETPLPAPGYPPPVVRQVDNLIRGYYLDKETSDVAVLAIPDFVSYGGHQSFQDTAVEFLRRAKQDGKKKLIIDLQHNSGGTILLAYDMYKLLFPTLIDHAAADRARAFEDLYIAGTEWSRFSKAFTRTNLSYEEDPALYGQLQIVSNWLNYESNLDVNSKPFPSWDAFFGPVQAKGDNFTNLFRWNLGDVMTRFNGYVDIHGYGPLASYNTTPFDAADIVVVTDGICASTCAVFAELMRQRAGVQFVALGGRPRPGLTQHIGGTRGTQGVSLPGVRSIANDTITFTNSSLAESQELNKTVLGQYWEQTFFDRAALFSAGGINFRDAIRDGDETQTPLQFVYETADCRILYTKPMMVDMTALWKRVAETAWGGKNHCVAGSLGAGNSHAGAGANRLRKRELTSEEQAFSEQMAQWRRGLKVEDYPSTSENGPRKFKSRANGGALALN